MAILMIGCSDKLDEKSITKTHDNSHKTFQLKIITYENLSLVNRAYDSNHNKLSNHYRLHRNKRLGWALWYTDGSYCEIHVVEIKDVNSIQFETWGHELGHCNYGSFHPEK